MRQLDPKAIARMPWEEFEGYLSQPTRSAARTSANDRAMREYFGDAEFAELQRLARQSASVRSRSTPLGTVIFLPGIMGSNLTRVEAGDNDLVWINLFRLALGQVESLRLTADGKRDSQAGISILPTAIDKRTYARALLFLRAHWDVLPFPFDWRKDIDQSADALATFIRERFHGQPTHLVAHSMGGLVARSFIRQNKPLWKKLSGEGGQGGRLVMMGTPNYGSFTVPQVLTGVEQLVNLLSKVDLRHNLGQILEITNTFVGSYEMLPAPDKLPEEMQALYREDAWGSFPVPDRHLDRAREFHETLKDQETIDPLRMTYVAGCNRATLAGLEIIAPGEFRYRETLDGDGRVPHALGLLEGVRTYYIEESHGDLPRNDQLLKAVDEILIRGTTSMLPEQPVTPRSVLPNNGQWYRSIEEYQTGFALEALAQRAVEKRVTPEEQRLAEETLLRAAIGAGRHLEGAAEIRGSTKSSRRRVRAAQRLEVEVVWGDVTRISAPVVVVGLYKGVKPVQKSGLGAIDARLDHWIAEAIRRGIVGGDLGQSFFVPIDRRQVAADTVLLAGMGAESRFSQDDLRYLMLNVTYGIAALGAKSYATVLIGAGTGNLNEDQALRGMLFGICDALERLPEKQKLTRVVLIEKNKERYQQIGEKLRVIKGEDSAARFNIAVKSRKHPSASARTETERTKDQPDMTFGPRITIERAGDVFRFSALTERAVIPVREVEVQSFVPDGASARLMESVSRDEQERLGRMLITSLMPEDFVDLFDSKDPVTFILDRSTAGIPWEMACLSTAQGPTFLGPGVALTRQFRTLLSQVPGISPPLGPKLRVLVVADPAPEPEYQLPGARREGRTVVRVLSELKTEYGLDIEVIDRIGDAECEPIDILSLILEGGFDLIHYAGHGIFDEKDPARGGWV
ncbi:MAG: M17 family peptidase N-terminal domain-containing protein, partial [Acidobacteriota bacterium]